MSGPADEGASPAQKRFRIGVFLPLLIFIGLALLFVFRLDAGDPSKLPSALIGRPIPTFDLPPVENLTDNGAPVRGLSSDDLGNGRVSIVNVWASWCVPCRQEHPFLLRLAADKRVTLYGLNYKDKAANARRFLGQHGNPFAAVGADSKGRVGIDWGVYGVPETFIVDGQGRIAYKHVGPISEQSLSETLMPAIEAALKAGS